MSETRIRPEGILGWLVAPLTTEITREMPESELFFSADDARVAADRLAQEHDTLYGLYKVSLVEIRKARVP